MAAQIDGTCILKEMRMLSAINSLKCGRIESVRAAAETYRVSLSSLRMRVRGRPSRTVRTLFKRTLSAPEEAVLVRSVLDLCARGFHPGISRVREMANVLLQKKEGGVVSGAWVNDFLNRHSEFKTKYRWANYKGALHGDPMPSDDWFRLVENTVAKYGIQDEDIYSFDEAAFALGSIETAKVVTSSGRRRAYKKFQKGSSEWASIIQAVSGQGRVIPCFLVLASQNHLSSWYQDTLVPQDWVITTTENGRTTDEVAFE